MSKFTSTELFFRISLFVTGVVNFIPAFLFFLPSKISTAYGIETPDASLELLLRHRAVLFGIIGGLLIYSALKKKYYIMTATVGLISMLTFILLFFAIGEDISKELGNVMKIDAIASLLLSVAFGIYISKIKKSYDPGTRSDLD